MYDVFLSYNRQDQDAVESVARALREHGLSPFIDLWYLVSGQSWINELEARLNDCGAIAIFIGPSGLGRWQQREKDLALDRQAQEPNFPVIPVLLPGSSDPALGFLKLVTWVDLRNGITPESIEMLKCAIHRQPIGHDVKERLARALATICPYRGLLPFREEDEPFFCGREAFTDKLAEAVAERNLVAVVGASGSGKSSVVYAGLIPRLRRGIKRADKDGIVWDMVALQPRDRPIHELSERLLSLLQPDIGEVDRLSEKKKLAEGLLSGEIDLRDVVERALAKQKGTDRILLVIDQWEELYTLCENEAEREQFIVQLLRATASSGLTVVLTLRGDFFGHALGNRELSDRLQDGIVNVAPMTREELRGAVVQPAEKVSLQFEDGLVDRILSDVGESPGRLPLLEFLLKELWEKRTCNILEHDVYDAIGGVSGAIAKRAEETFGRLQEKEREQLHWAMIRLVAPGPDAVDTRKRAVITDLDPQALGVIRKLAGDRLLVVERDMLGHETVEVSHEALIREWPRLKEWVNENRQHLQILERLEQDAKAWQRGERGDDLLLPAGRRLAEAEELLKAVPRLISPLVKEYVDDSAGWHEAERKRKHEAEIAVLKEREASAHALAASTRRVVVRTRIAAAVATGLLLSATYAAYYGFQQAGIAERQTEIAKAQAAYAQRQEQFAKENAEFAKEQSERAERQANQAAAHFALALGATTKVLDEVKNNLNNNQIATDVAEKLLSRADSTLKQLHEAAPTADVADAQINLLFAASDVFTRLGRLGDAYDRANKAEQLAKQQSLADPKSLRWQRTLYNSYFRLGDNLASQSQLGEALKAYETALDVAERVAKEHPSSRAQFNLSFVNNKIGDIAKIRGDLERALGRYKASLDIISAVHRAEPENAEWLRQLAATHTWVADALSGLGRTDEAVDYYWMALKDRKKLYEQDTNHAGLRSNLATSHARLGEVLATRGDKAGLEHHRQAFELRHRNAERDHTNLDAQSQLAFSHVYIGDALKTDGDLPGALQEYHSALDIRQKLAKKQPKNVHWQANVAATWVRLGDAESGDDPDAALRSYREALAILDPLAKEHADNVGIPRDIFISRVRVADVLAAKEDVAGAVREYRAALAIVAPIVPKTIMIGAGWRLSVPSAHNRLAAALHKSGDELGALEEHRIVQRMVREHAARLPPNVRLKDAADSHRGIAAILAGMGQFKEASQEIASAQQILRDLIERHPKNEEYRMALKAVSQQSSRADEESRPESPLPAPR